MNPTRQGRRHQALGLVAMTFVFGCAQASPADDETPDGDTPDSLVAPDDTGASLDVPAAPPEASLSVDAGPPLPDAPAPPPDAPTGPSDTGPGATPDTGPAPCPAGQARCMGSDGSPACVALQSDRTHCGACNNACPGNNACTQGRCVVACPAGQVACTSASGATVCADLTRDPARCGSCAVACLPGESCTLGRCVSPCAAGEALCAGRCQRVLTDDAHCGQCDAACPAGSRCTQGVCAPLCTTGQVFCEGSCHDPQTDPQHCNGCGRACPAGQSCVRGGCTVVCAPGEVNCTNVCRDLTTDPAHCGMCNNVCLRGRVCTEGVCTLSCATGQTACGSSCVSLSTDVNHCGMCNTACAPRTNATARCFLGSCRWTCTTGWGDCDSSTTNGCETNLTSSTLHCGACRNACPARPSAFTRCASGTCGFTCLSGYADCNGVATDGCEVNTRTNAAHCGACGTACPIGRACVNGACASGTTAIETFEAAPWPRSPWVALTSSAGTRETSCAQSGSYGLLNPGWIYRTDVSVGAVGTRYSAWFRASSGTTGRGYMGFGANSTGAWSLIAGFNTRELMLQRNANYQYTEVGATPYTWSVGTWYRLEVEFLSASRVTGRAYSASGALLATVSATLTGFTPGGVALRTFGGVCVDTLERR